MFNIFFRIADMLLFSPTHVKIYYICSFTFSKLGLFIQSWKIIKNIEV